MEQEQQQDVQDIIMHLLKALGEDPEKEGLAETPRRVAAMYQELLWGKTQDARDVLRVGFEEQHYELVIVKDISFYSLCEHHLLPFHGIAHVAYLPNGRVVGISKLARVVEILSRQLQLQERLTSQIADVIMETLQPQGVGVVLEGEHLCMTMRGVRKPGSKVVTSVMRGVFREDAQARAELLSFLHPSG